VTRSAFYLRGRKVKELRQLLSCHLMIAIIKHARNRLEGSGIGLRKQLLST
jgi:hypothetical protein